MYGGAGAEGGVTSMWIQMTWQWLRVVDCLHGDNTYGVEEKFKVQGQTRSILSQTVYIST